MLNQSRRAALLPATALFLFGACMAFAGPPPIEAFGRKPAMISVDINPAGTRLAWVEDDGSAARIIFYDVASGKNLRTVRVPPENKMWELHWANDETVLINESVTQTERTGAQETNEWQRWVALDASGGADRLLLMRDAVREWVTGATLIRARTADPGKIYMSTLDWSAMKYTQETGSRLAGGRKDDGWIKNAYEVDLKTGAGRLFASGTPFTDDWLIDATGKVIVRSEYNPQYAQHTILVKAGVSWRKIYDEKKCGGLNLVSLASDNAAVLARGRVCGEDRIKLWSIPLDGSPMKALLEDVTAEVDESIHDPFDDTLLGVALTGPGHPVRWLDPQSERRSGALHRSFGTRAVTLLGRSADYQKVVALVEDEVHPPTYYLVDYRSKKADIINEAYPLLSGVELGTVREFAYAARDNYPLTGYLTLPPGSAGKNLPLVVMPHGGPESRDELTSFDWMAQFLASRGFAVLQPQFRGSTGLGQAHADAGRHQWGLRMQDDVSDGVKALTAQGIADPKRVCIVGWSYGGYSALAGAAFTPDLYACAVSIGGISDLPALIRWDSKVGWGRESNQFAYWRDHIGAAGDEQVISRSPARAAAAVLAPILLIHGVNDTVVPIAQSQLMAQVLKAQNKPVELIELAGEDHWMKTHNSSRIRTLTELERFLGRYIGNLPPRNASN